MASEIDRPFFLRNIWYYALPSEQLKTGQMKAKTLLGEPIVFGRQQTGEVFALKDICPHRAVPLSCGRFDGRELECAYHGWRFDHQGHCTAIPSLTSDQNLNLSLFGVPRYPVKEVQGNIWIYMSATDQPKCDEPTMAIPLVPDFGDRPYQAIQTFQFPCYIDHAVVGLMDPAHGPFVHRTWWWRSKGALFEKSKTFDPLPYGFTMRRHQLLKKSLGYRILGGNPSVEIAFHLPGVRIEHVSTGQHSLCNLTTVTPLSANETEVTTMFYWTVPWLGLLKPILLPFVRTFFHQDRDMVVKQQTRLSYNPALMLVKDADTQAKWYYQIKSEYARSVSEGRSFENPLKSQILRWRS